MVDGSHSRLEPADDVAGVLILIVARLGDYTHQCQHYARTHAQMALLMMPEARQARKAHRLRR